MKNLFKLLVAPMLLLPATALAQAGPYVVSKDTMPTFVNEPGNLGFTILLDQSTGSGEGVSLGVFLPGSVVAEHTHPGAAEILYVMSGTLEMVIGGQSVVAKEGSAIYIPPDVLHSARVTDAIHPARVVQVYSPGGQEQRFRTWTPQQP